MTEISVSGLVKSFEIGNNILDGITFQVETGERVGLLGRNGAGKSTLLNVMAEALGLLRGAVYNRSDFFSDYIALCRWDAGALPPHSRILTSDDVFDHLLGIRELNEGIHQKRAELFQEYTSARNRSIQLQSLEEYEAFSRVVDAQR